MLPRILQLLQQLDKLRQELEDQQQAADNSTNASAGADTTSRDEPSTPSDEATVECSKGSETGPTTQPVNSVSASALHKRIADPVTLAAHVAFAPGSTPVPISDDTVRAQVVIAAAAACGNVTRLHTDPTLEVCLSSRKAGTQRGGLDDCGREENATHETHGATTQHREMCTHTHAHTHTHTLSLSLSLLTFLSANDQMIGLLEFSSPRSARACLHQTLNTTMQRCPHTTAITASEVPTVFFDDDIVGFHHEAAGHDYTLPPSSTGEPDAQRAGVGESARDCAVSFSIALQPAFVVANLSAIGVVRVSDSQHHNAAALRAAGDALEGEGEKEVQEGQAKGEQEEVTQAASSDQVGEEAGVFAVPMHNSVAVLHVPANVSKDALAHTMEAFGEVQAVSVSTCCLSLPC